MPHYDLELRPPAPFTEVSITNFATGQSVRLPGKVDTGAGITVIPERVVRDLVLPKAGEMLCQSYDGARTWHPVHYVDLDIAGRHLPRIKVVSTARLYVLLGRDVLNQFILTLDGKALTFNLRDP
jgi:predicted aspartyl protease